ncbi:hypothetical protein BCR42DRAFT_488337 [Absidia repens]|uniref:Protein kinase domain-containing protein n=1 Tax=Absidia repens TaxID=90262 RepID=A0A1X2IRS2_9FUNG|nr:hypothetical protein BCR42DRAFT_488337 [Absidia repens]
MPLRVVSEQVRNKWRRRSDPILSNVNQNQQPKQQETPASLSPPSIKSQQQESKPTPPQPKTDKPSKHSPNDLTPNPDTLVFGIGDYQFLSQLGEGKFSKVMLAQHYLTGERFAIKMIDKRVFDDRVMSRLIREIGIMEALHHPNIARLYETFETACTLYLVMEYIPGVNLDEYLKRKGGSLKEDEARVIFRQVVAAVDYCHRKWVVHRDLKAPNILLTKNNQVHLVDFGLSNRFGHQRLRTICGSMLYYSPEIINGKKYIGPEVDCWCLGICLFRMVAGFEAFSHAKTIGELRKDILNRNYPMPPHFSNGLKRTIQKCLSTDRRKRSSLCNALEGDPWLNNSGQYDDLFSDASNYHAAMYQFAIPSSMSTDAITLEARQQERDQQQRHYLRDMEEEKRVGYKARKTIIHHAYNTSFYYTGHGRREERSLLEPSRAALYQEILTVLNQVSLCPVNYVHFSSLKLPMTHLLRKWKRADINNGHSSFHSQDRPSSSVSPSSASIVSESPSTHHQHHPPIGSSRLSKKSSTVSISQLYQRTKDKTCYFSIRSNARVISSTTVLSLTSSSDTAISLLDNDHHHHHLPPRQSSSDNTAQDESELVLLVRSVCELLGVTYLHESKTQLNCMLTLCNYKEDDHLQQQHQSLPISNQQKLIPRKTSLRHLFSVATGSISVSGGDGTSGGVPISLLKKKKSFANNSLYPENIVLPLDASNSKQQIEEQRQDIIGIKEGSSEWWTRQQQRLSLPYITTGVSKQQQQQRTLRHSSSVQVIRSTPGIFGLRGKASIDNFFQRKQVGDVDGGVGDVNGLSDQQSGTGSVTDGTAVFSIEVFSVPSKQMENADTRLLGLRFTKMSGSVKVYKLATGWITNVLQSKTQLV